jgi:WD40 repeat protein
VLVVDPGMHTSGIRDAAVDAAARFAATVSYDKTVRIWSLVDGKLLRTIRVPAGPGHIGKLDTVAMSPDGNLVAAGGWTKGNHSGHNIYLFDRSTGRMTMRIGGLPAVIDKLVFSPDGRYLAAGLHHHHGLRVFDRDKQWAETFRDTDYGYPIYAGSFAADGRLAIASLDGKIRLYDANFASVVPPQNAPGGDHPRGLAFSPNGAVLAVVYDDSVSVNLVDGHTLAPLPGPNTRGLHGPGNNFIAVAWSADGQTLFAGGMYHFPDYSGNPVVAWSDAGRGARRTIPGRTDTIMAVLPLRAGELLVAAQDPQLEIVELSGNARWVARRPIAQFNAQRAVLAVSADGTIVDFGFDWGGKSPLRFDLRALKLTSDMPADGHTVPPKQDGLPISRWANSKDPT